MKDLLLNPETGDLLIKDGDFVIGTSDMQNKARLLQLPKGAIKQFPTSTVGLANYIESEDVQGMVREIKQCFTADGMKVNYVGFDKQGKLIIDANY